MKNLFEQVKLGRRGNVIVTEAIVRLSSRLASNGINKMLGERRRSQASATCMGVASSRAASSDKAADCNRLKPQVPLG